VLVEVLPDDDRLVLLELLLETDVLDDELLDHEDHELETED
jgi:hypothetical protein